MSRGGTVQAHSRSRSSQVDLHRNPCRMPSSSPSPIDGLTPSQHQAKIDEMKDDEDDITQTKAVLERPRELTPFGASPPFSSLVHILEKIRDAQGKEKKKGALQAYFKAWRERVGRDLVSRHPPPRHRAPSGSSETDISARSAFPSLTVPSSASPDTRGESLASLSRAGGRNGGKERAC